MAMPPKSDKNLEKLKSEMEAKLCTNLDTPSGSLFSLFTSNYKNKCITLSIISVLNF